MIPGSVAKHAIVSDECRSNRGDMAAAHEAATSIVEEYRACFPAWKDKGAKFHFVLTVERPVPAVAFNMPIIAKDREDESKSRIPLTRLPAGGDLQTLLTENAALRARCETAERTIGDAADIVGRAMDAQCRKIASLESALAASQTRIAEMQKVVDAARSVIPTEPYTSWGNSPVAYLHGALNAYDAAASPSSESES